MWVTRILAISLVTVGDPDTLTGGYLYHRRLAELAPLHNARINFVSLPASPFPLPLLEWKSALRCIQATAPQVVVIDSIAAAYAAPWLESLRVPVVGMLHQPPGGIDHGTLRTRVQALLDRAAHRRSDCLLVASHSLADIIASEGFDAPVVVVPPGRDPSPPIEELSLDLHRGARTAFLCVANWVKRKGLIELLEAFSRLACGGGCLHLAGDRAIEPRYSDGVAARLAHPDLAGRVIVHGRVSRERIAALYHAADVFVLASFKEPYGTVYGEAMASGLPVVGWRAGNLPYLATDGVHGLIVPPGDVQALGAALDRLSRDAALRRTMGKAARARAESFPTWKRSAEMFFGALRAALDA
jgi:glycosyltransferase involved in cell wall biosynthesis